MTLRSTRRIQRHTELLELLIRHPVEGREAIQALGVGSPTTQKEERALIRRIKERVNGSNHSR